MMRLGYILLCAMIALILSCSPKPSTKPATGFGTARAGDLKVKPSSEEISMEWGAPAKTTIEITWAAGQKYPVQVIPASGSPSWLTLETKPMILEPPGMMELSLTAAVGGELGEHRLAFEATAYGLEHPVTFDLMVTISRQDGEFHRLLPSQKSLECNNICGKMTGSNVTFYDLLKEKLQECGDDPLPDAQKIGARSFGVGQKGWGYGRTCEIAGIYEAAGTLSLVNIGYLSLPVKRGEVLFSVRGADDCWLSPDNSIAVIRAGSSYQPYDVFSGQPIGDGCRARMEVGRATLYGSKLEAGECVWTLP